MSVSIRIATGPFPAKLIIDGHSFVCFKQSGSVYKYSAEDTVLADTERILYVRPVQEDALEEFLPYEIAVNSKPYIRRMDGFYTPSEILPSEVERFFNLIALEYEKYITPALNAKLYKALLDRARGALGEDRVACRILDYGCGVDGLPGRVRRVWQESNVEVYGVDISRKMVGLSKLKGHKNVYKCGYGYRQTPFISNFFDVIILCFVVHYFPDSQPFRELFRLLRPGGVLVFNMHKPHPGYEDRYLNILKNPPVGLTSVKFDVARLIEDKRKRNVPICISRKSSTVSAIENREAPCTDVLSLG